MLLHELTCTPERKLEPSRNSRKIQSFERCTTTILTGAERHDAQYKSKEGKTKAANRQRHDANRTHELSSGLTDQSSKTRLLLDKRGCSFIVCWF